MAFVFKKVIWVDGEIIRLKWYVHHHVTIGPHTSKSLLSKGIRSNTEIHICEKRSWSAYDSGFVHFNILRLMDEYN